MNRKSDEDIPTNAEKPDSSKRPKGYDSSAALVASLSDVLRLPISERQYDDVLAIVQSPYKGALSSVSYDSAFRSLLDWPRCPQLAVELALSSRLSKGTGLVTSLARRLRDEYSVEIRYPPDSEDRYTQVSDWVDTFLRSACSLAKRTQPAAEAILTADQYKALTCLVLETLPPWEAIYRFLSHVCRVDKTNGGSHELRPESFAFFRRLQSALSGNGNSKRLQQGLDWSGPLLVLLAARVAERDAARKELQELSDARLRMRERLEEVYVESGEYKTKIASLEGELDHLRRNLANAEEVMRERELHWQITATNQHARFVSDVRNQLAHEIVEACLALDAATPSLNMALRRLKQAQMIISNLE